MPRQDGCRWRHLIFSPFKPSPRLESVNPVARKREVEMKRTNHKPMPMPVKLKLKLKTFDVFHGQKQIGQVQAEDSNEAYRQAREHHKIPLAVIGRKEGV